MSNGAITQKTIQSKVSYSGIGIHTGSVVNITFCPAPIGTGITFKRTDIEGEPVIPATIDYVCDTARSTTLGRDDIRIHTVEHVLAAVRAMNITNLCIEISSIEPPIANGSSDVFIELIESVGLEDQNKSARVLSLKKPVYYSNGDIHIVGLPHDGYKIGYTLSYPNSKVLGCQYYSTEITPETFKEELASCRTFSQYEEVSHLMDRGLIKGGSLENAVIIKDEAIISKGGLFFSNEMVRHKILDIVGDLSLIGFAFNAHIISIKSGHESNHAFAKKLYQTLSMEEQLCQQN